MSTEQVKINKFFDKLTASGTKNILSWIGIVCLMILTLMLCACPAQDIYNNSEAGPLVIPGVLCMFSYWMLYLRTSHYKLYTENQKSRLMAEILQYHPISKKEMWKIKEKCVIIFEAKIILVGLLIQLTSSYANYGAISVLEFVHIILCVFLFPVVAEIIFDGLTGAYTEK